MLRHANNKHQTFIAKTGVTYAGGITHASGTKVTKDNLPAGAVAIVTLGNVVIDAIGQLNGENRFKIVQSRGPNYPLTFSPVIEKSAALTVAQSPNLTATGIPYGAPVQQKTTFGFYDGTNIFTETVEDNTSYYVVIEKEDNDSVNNKGYWPAITGQYKTDGSSTSLELMMGLANSVFQNTLFEAGDTKYIRVATTLGDAGEASPYTPTATAFPVAAVDLARGSKHILNADAIADLTTATITAGKVIEITGVNGTLDYYVIESVTSVEAAVTRITLTTPYRGTSGAGTAKLVTTATVDERWGVSLEGVQPPFDVLRNRNYAVNRFSAKVMIGDSIATDIPVTKVAKAYEGVGTWEQAAMDEFLSWGFLGNARAVVATPPGVRPATVVEGSAYSIIQLVEKTDIPAMTSFSSSAMSYLIYVENTTSSGGTVTGQGDNLATILGGLTID